MPTTKSRREDAGRPKRNPNHSPNKEEETMIAKVKARFSNGALTPLEPIDLEEGKEVVVFIQEVSHESVAQGANVLEDISTLAERLIEQYPDDGDDQPTDGSINYKHYLYGHPKKEL